MGLKEAHVIKAQNKQCCAVADIYIQKVRWNSDKFNVTQGGLYNNITDYLHMQKILVVTMHLPNVFLNTIIFKCLFLSSFTVGDKTKCNIWYPHFNMIKKKYMEMEN